MNRGGALERTTEDGHVSVHANTHAADGTAQSRRCDTRKQKSPMTGQMRPRRSGTAFVGEIH